MNSRREFIARGCQLAAVASLPVSALAALPEVDEAHASSARISLTGVWQFQLDPDRTGETKLWHKPTAGPDWLAVEVPHTWQIRKDSADYFGSAWYHRAFQVPREWKDSNLLVEFEALYHAADESSPIEWLAVEGAGKEFTIRVRTRKTVPAYTLEGYKLQAVLYGYSEIPLERYEAPLPRLAPGDEAKVSVQWKERSRCAWYSMFSVPRDFRLSRRVGHLKSARKILENQIRS